LSAGHILSSIGLAAVIGGVFRHDTYFLYADKTATSIGVLPLAHVNSRLFGNALVRLPFAVYGGVAAQLTQRPRALEARGPGIAKRLLGASIWSCATSIARHA
jgi:hypothetical protein